jgi:hypothetical protein
LVREVGYLYLKMQELGLIVKIGSIFLIPLKWQVSLTRRGLNRRGIVKLEVNGVKNKILLGLIAFSAFYILLRAIMVILQFNHYVIYSVGFKYDFTTGIIFYDALIIVVAAIACTNYFKSCGLGFTIIVMFLPLYITFVFIFLIFTASDYQHLSRKKTKGPESIIKLDINRINGQYDMVSLYSYRKVFPFIYKFQSRFDKNYKTSGSFDYISDFRNHKYFISGDGKSLTIDDLKVTLY